MAAEHVGYEAIALESMLSGIHSYHCNSLLGTIRRREEVEINRFGLFVDGTVARAWARRIEDENLGEPLAWFAVSLAVLPPPAIE